jgi:catechol 2,3-dioxygenase-like lactoylglutathione lyase family enzyme
MNVLGLCWLGTHTEHFGQMVDFLATVLGADLIHQERDFAVFRLPDGAKVEVFGRESAYNQHFTTGPVGGFLVSDVHAATEELRAAGIDIVQEPGATHWAHFRGPDGRLYAITADPALLPG